MVIAHSKVPYKDFTDEVKFQVGQRVHVEIEEIPIEERDVTTGIIIGIQTNFHAAPILRKIKYVVRFDGKGNYSKDSKITALASLLGGRLGFEFTCEARRLRITK